MMKRKKNESPIAFLTRAAKMGEVTRQPLLYRDDVCSVINASKIYLEMLMKEAGIKYVETEKFNDTYNYKKITLVDAQSLYYMVAARNTHEKR